MMNPKLTWTSLPAQRLAAQPELQAEWDRLNDERSGGVPVLAASMVCAAIDVFSTEADRLLVGRRGDQVDAMVVLRPVGHLRWQTFQPSQLPLGPWVAAPGIDAAELADAILSSGVLGFALVVAISQIDPRLAPRPSDRSRIQVLDYVATGWIDVAGSFDDYWAGRGKNLRQNLRKQRNRLAASEVATEMRTISRPAAMRDAIGRYGTLEGKGWKASEGTAILPDNDQGRFYGQLLERTAAQGLGCVFEYWFGDRLVASEICIQRQRTLVILKTTYDEAERQFSPAFLLREEELRLWFGAGAIDRVEFYGRLMEWHTRWTGNSVQLYHVSAYRWEWLRQLAGRVGERNRRKAAQAAQTETATAESASA